MWDSVSCPRILWHIVTHKEGGSKALMSQKYQDMDTRINHWRNKQNELRVQRKLLKSWRNCRRLWQLHGEPQDSGRASNTYLNQPAQKKMKRSNKNQDLKLKNNNKQLIFRSLVIPHLFLVGKENFSLFLLKFMVVNCSFFFFVCSVCPSSFMDCIWVWNKVIRKMNVWFDM